MKKQKNSFRLLIKTMGICFLISYFGSAAQAESILFTASFTNNTGGDLNFVGYNAHPEYKIIQHLPFGTWKNGETRIIAFEVETGPIAEAIFYTFEGEITTLTYNYTGSLASGSGTYPLRFSFIPGKTAESSHLMIFDTGRAKDYDGLDVCKGGNKNGSPFFCVANNLPVSIHNGDVASTYLTYDKNPEHTYPAPHLEGGEEVFLLPQVEMQLLAKDDTTMSLMTRKIPFKSDITVEKTDVADPGGNLIPYARTWFFDPNTRKIHNGGYGNYLDMCLGTPALHSAQRVILDKCDALQVHDWVLNSNGMISNHGFCLTRELDAQTGKMVIWRRECHDYRTDQRWLIKPKHTIEEARTIRPLSATYDGKCLDNNNNKFLTDLAMVKLIDCGSPLTQSWTFNENNQIEYAYGSELCLGHLSGWDKDATPVKLYECKKEDAQRWIYDGITKQLKFFPKLEKCAGIGSGNEMKLYGCEEGKESQKWKIEIENPVNLTEKKVASIRPLKDKSYCIDNKAGGTTNKNNILLWECDGPEGNNNQKWFFDGSTIRLSNHRNKCLDLLGNHTNNATNIELYDCNGSTAQDWVYDELTKTIRLKRDLSKCIDLVNGITSNGTNIQIWTCNPNSKNMQWILEPAEPNPANALFGEIRHVGDNSRCIDLNGNKVANESNIQSWPCNDKPAQRWFVDDKQIKLIEHPAYCIDLPHSDTRDDNNIQLYKCHGDANQDWIFDATYKFIRSSIDPNKCIYVNDGYDMRLTTCDYQDPSRMQWTFPGNYSESLDGDNLRIHVVKEEGKCVDMADNKEGSNIRVYTCQTDQSQYFVFDGATIKRANDPNLCLDIEWGKLDNGTNIRLWHCNGTDAQKWIYDGVSGRIHSKKDPNKCIHLANDSTTNGSNIEISDCNDDQAEIFVIK